MTPHILFVGNANYASLTTLLEQEGFAVSVLKTTSELESYSEVEADCALIDMDTPIGREFDGEDGWNSILSPLTPVVVTTSMATGGDVMNWIRWGAIEIFMEPCVPGLVIRRLIEGARMGKRRMDWVERCEATQCRLDSLSNRETEVLQWVVGGSLTKQIAKQLGVSVKTIEVHRSNITKKMNVRSIAELVRNVTEHRIFHQELSFFSPWSLSSQPILHPC